MKPMGLDANAKPSRRTAPVSSAVPPARAAETPFWTTSAAVNTLVLAALARATAAWAFCATVAAMTDGRSVAKMPLAICQPSERMVAA